ncbi:MAG: hypothetical protein AAGF48_14930 [Pseudomonadota bacterium]
MATYRLKQTVIYEIEAEDEAHAEWVWVNCGEEDEGVTFIACEDREIEPVGYPE